MDFLVVYDFSMNIADKNEAQKIDYKASKDFKMLPITRMEIAGYKSFEIIMEKLNPKKVLLIIGFGNNGGDGLVIAKYLHLRNISVELFFIKSNKKKTFEYIKNQEIIKKLKIKILQKIDNKKLNEFDLIIDGIFGIGLNRKILKNTKTYNLINLINKSKTKVCSLDIPSGQCATSGHELGISIISDVTITYDILKVGLVNHPGFKNSRKIYIVNLGTPESLMKDTKNFYLNDIFFKNLILKRDNSSNKGSHGHVLIIGGSKNMPGAVTIAGLSAYKAGCGLVTICVPKSISDIVKKNLPEAIIIEIPNYKDNSTFDDKNFINILKNKISKSPSSIIIGPGMSSQVRFKNLIKNILLEFNSKIILDADGLNSFGEDIKTLKKYKREIIITPHPGEMSSLLNSKISEIQNNREIISRNFSKKNNLITVLKGFRTVIALPNGNVYINSSGNNGMATGGMGDSLAGIIGSLSAQGYKIENAAILGTYLHGRTGDAISQKNIKRGILARDIISNLSKTFEVIKKGDSQRPDFFINE